MNTPTLDLQEFIKEYGTYTFPEKNVLQGDFFRKRDGDGWLTALLCEQGGKQILADTTGDVLCRYDRIIPLFITPPVKISTEVQDLLEQLSRLRSRTSQERYEQARCALQTLVQPSHPLAPAYLVLQDGRMGVVDPTGTVIVPPEYQQITPFAFVHPGDAGVFLCRKEGHRLNSMDVYDWMGACIFQQIGDLIPREETILTPAGSGGPLRKIKTLWVVRQAVDLPFPENPDIQLVREIPKRYSLQELRRSGSDELRTGAMEDRPLWLHCPREDLPPAEVLSPLVATVANQIGCTAAEVLSRLSDYRTFRRERPPLSVRLADVTAHTLLDQLGLGVRAYHCLVRSGLQTAGDVMALSEDAIAGLPRITDAQLQEITALRKALIEMTTPS